MKKSFLVFLIVVFSVSGILAADITATTSTGKTVVLHDNGRWEYVTSSVAATKPYVGRWAITDEMFESLVDAVLAESGIYSWSTQYAYYKAVLMETMKEGMGELGNSFIVLKEKGFVEISDEGEITQGTYVVNESTRLLTITVDGESLPFGTFSSDYKKLYFAGQSVLFMSKIAAK